MAVRPRGAAVRVAMHELGGVRGGVGTRVGGYGVRVVGTRVGVLVRVPGVVRVLGPPDPSRDTAGQTSLGPSGSLLARPL